MPATDQLENAKYYGVSLENKMTVFLISYFAAPKTKFDLE